MERLVRAIVVAGASLATAWWLLRDWPKQEPLSAAAPTPSAPAPRAEVHATVPEVATRDVERVAETHSPEPAADEPRAVVATGAGDAVEPIPLIEGITLPGGMWNLHTMMEREPRAAEWAANMEQQFSAYFASKPELARNFGQPIVLCRSRFCEIQAVGYGPQAFAAWSSATGDLRDQAWARELRAGGVYTTERSPNEHAVVLILLRPWIVTRDVRSELRLADPVAR